MAFNYNSISQDQRPPGYSPAAFASGSGSIHQRLLGNRNIETQDDYDYKKEIPEKPVLKETFDETFKIEKPKYNDWFFTVIFISTWVGLFALSYINFRQLISDYNAKGGLNFIFRSTNNISENSVAHSASQYSFHASFQSIADTSTLKNLVDEKPSPTPPPHEGIDLNMTTIATIILSVVSFPVLISILILGVMFLFPMFFITIGYLVLPLGLLSTVFYSVFISSAPISILTVGLPLIGFFFSLAFFFSQLNRIRFTAHLFKIVISVMFQYPSGILVSFLSSCVSGLLSLIIFTLSSIIYQNRRNIDQAGCPHENGGDVCVSNETFIYTTFVLFAGYFTFEVVSNVTHAVISGIYGSYFHFGKNGPKYPAYGAFVRAISYSFGSICFGSLLVSLVSTLRSLLTIFKEKILDELSRSRESDDDDDDGDNFDGGVGNRENSSSSLIFILIFNVLEFLIVEIENCFKLFNKYAFSYVALYGTSYISSAKQTFNFLKYRGLQVLIAKSLIESTLTVFSILCSIFSLLGFILMLNFLKFTFSDYPELYIIGGFSQLIIGYFISKITSNSINGGYITLLVCLSMYPEVFKANHPKEFEQLIKFTPSLQQPLNS
ncbi:hypothetical protein BVG19_g1060 [[Candida] boidinii]|nr:hypothetical protein BVG19_g1060 [[Candida] boidinii]OWB50669.1 hypothetical protein B5S27_g2221 [[Candida] boidinii]OWB82726.1 hypothetical protein B5S33_g1354 [[Candida] boidinii]